MDTTTLSEAVPVPGTGRITMIHAVSGKGRVEECLLELDMDTGRCRIAPLPGMGEGLKLRWFTGDWLLVQGNGEILSDDFAQLINMNTREVLRIRPEMFGGEKMQHIGILTDGTVVIVTRRDRVGPVFRYPIDFWGFLRTANKSKKLEWREYKEVYPNLPIFLPSKATERKIILKKRQPDNPGGRYLRRRLLCRSWRKSWGLPTLSCKMEHEKAPLQAERVPIPRHLLCGTNLDYRAGWTKMSRPSKPLVSG